MKMNFHKKLMIAGFALILFGIIPAVMQESGWAYASGGFGLFFVIVGCFGHPEESSDTNEASKTDD